MDFYAIPFQDQMILYRPRRHLAFLGNAALVEYAQRRLAGEPPSRPEIDEFLDSVGFFMPLVPCHELPDVRKVKPTQAVLLMTNRCNLRCTYCYADGGRSQTVEEITWPTAKAVIDRAFQNASKQKNEKLGLTFHGGGEPTLHWDLLKRAVEYARNLDEHCEVSCSSNGIWTAEQTAFICEHFSNVSLSIDGIEEVQNMQRPFPNGKGSFEPAMKSAAALDEAGVAYGIRMTVLPESVDTLVDSVRYFLENTATRSIQIEPTFTSTHGQYADLSGEFAERFSQRFMEAWDVGVERGRQVYYSGARPWVLSCAFCLAPIRALCVTADEKLVTCFEIFSGALDESYIVGEVRKGEVLHDTSALQRFLDETHRRRQECVDCFCYWHCCGDCSTRRPVSAPMTSGRCQVTRIVTRELLARYIVAENGVWMGRKEVRMDENRGNDHRQDERLTEV